MKLHSTGSVKNLWVERNPSNDSLGVGAFEFTNDYSVFDWGKMPQQLPDKGEALKRETVHWFRSLEGRGLKTQFIEETDKTKIKVKLFRKLEYAEISGSCSNFMLPLEIIFRNKVTPTSSLFRRLKKETADPTAYGLPEGFLPRDGETIVLPKPLVEFSTKIEDTDRYIDDSEAVSLAGITIDELKSVRNVALTVNRIVTEEVKDRGLDHIDGKIEVAMGSKRDIYICDTVGTSDENRFLYKGLDLSKQMLRDYYILDGWYDELTKAREEGSELPKPKEMEPDYLNLVNDTYKSLCVAITGEPWGEVEPPSLDEIVKRYQDWIKEKKEGL
ncbi:MAG: phosphoribosylaminoimidazolesuccinocarboxamide synthase [Halobacteriota archaeon]|nr:phosphoribosylaminoimidazolesuccinocarboxamide synthase [Halobacteriota archaeon]